MPWGLLIGGEELHNNHHAYPTSAKLSAKGYELDIGWLYIRILEAMGLATIKHVAPISMHDSVKRNGHWPMAVLRGDPLHWDPACCAEPQRLRPRRGRLKRCEDPG